MRALTASPFLLRAFIFLALAALASVAVAAGKVYQWKDAKGVTHFSDSPPPAQKYQDRRIDNRGEPIPEVAAGKTVENPQCGVAKSNLALLSGNSDVQQDTDGDGKPDKVLGADDRANQRSLAEAAVKAFCPPAITAGR